MEISETIQQALLSCSQHLSRRAGKRVAQWLTEDAYADHVAEILRLVKAGAWAELEDGFRAVLPFGTGGRRGPRGVGPNRINARTIAESARGLADWTLRTRKNRPCRVVIAYDTRIASAELARVCAEVLSRAGLQVYLFSECRPTPELSFSVRHLRADAGIVISASHNPPSDNGFKAYGPDGGQIPPPKDLAVMRAVKRLAGKPIPRMPFDEAVGTGLVRFVGTEMDDAFREAVLACGLATERQVSIVYTPLHGTGIHTVPPVLKAAGFTNVSLVEEQASPDGMFPTVPNSKPNPEEPPALELAGILARRSGADIAIGTDPDADRLGCIAVRRSPNPAHASASSATWHALTGNQIGAILCDHVLGMRAATGRLNGNPLVLTTAVTSPLIGKIAASYGVAVIQDLLVGFKYVACVLDSLAEPDRMAFACEESHGYLTGPYTRDKDAACAALMIAEAAARANASNSDLWAVLDGLHRRLGYHADIMFSEELSPVGGRTRIRNMTSGLRANLPNSIGGLPVLRVIDRLHCQVHLPGASSSEPYPDIEDPLTHRPIAALQPARDNLLIFELGGTGCAAGARVAIRPSGTEPKCKFYTSVWTEPTDELDAFRSETDACAQELQNSFVELARSYA
jgi:phosphoglucomutase/phosphomannomutase